MYTDLTHDVKKAAEYIAQGRVIAFPTGTAYGLACDALQGHALQRLRILKQRPQEKTFTVFMSSRVIHQYIDIFKEEQELWEKSQGQPLTLLVKPKDSLQHLAQEGRVGLRMIDHPLMQELANAVDVPLTATSANLSGQPAAYSPDIIIQQFPARSGSDLTTYNLSLAAILDGGTLSQNPPTTIAKIESGQIEIIRQGSLKL